MTAAFLAFDTETGGITVDNSLLTAYYAVLDKDFNIIDSIDLAIKPDNRAPYIVTAGGLAINKINLVEHDKIAITESEAGGVLLAFIKKHSVDGKVKLIPVGHNVSFDVDFTTNHILSKKNFLQYVSYRKLDTGTIAQFLKMSGLLPDDHLGSLEHLAEFYNISFKDRPHTAESDTLVTIELLKAMRNHVQGKSKD